MMIKSLLDNDLYKFTMMQGVLHHYPSTMVKYQFKCRNGNGLPDNEKDYDKFIHNLKHEILLMDQLKLSSNEVEYLKTIKFFKPDFVEYLRMFNFNHNYINVCIKEHELFLEIEGPWLQIILYEVPLLAIISELLCKNRENNGIEILSNELLKLNEYYDKSGYTIDIAEFGTRRRFSFNHQNNVVSFMEDIYPNYLIGTSNLYLAMIHNIKPIGTMAHEWLQAHQQLGGRLCDFQKHALQTWANEYRGDLGIALTDCINMKSFLNDFDKYFSKLFDGGRHDSGSPIDWCNKFISHYESMGIDPKTKCAVFSDGLNIDKAIELHKAFHNRINISFGIGTFLTNNVNIGGKIAPSIVIKMVECNGKPVAKISDSPGKGMCKDENYLNNLKKEFNL